MNSKGCRRRLWFHQKPTQYVSWLKYIIWPLTPKSKQHIYESNYICDQIWVKFSSLVFEIWCSQGFWGCTDSLTNVHTQKQYASSIEVFWWQRHKSCRTTGNITLFITGTSHAWVQKQSCMEANVIPALQNQCANKSHHSSLHTGEFFLKIQIIYL